MHNSVSFYARTRIEQQLSHLQDYPLTVVVAGAGYGKTTTVSQYLRHNGTEYLWISITSPDEQLFWENLCQSCQRFGKDIADELTIIGIPQNDWLISRLVCFLGNHCLSPLVVCIDDWQNIGEGSHLGRLLGAIALSEIPNLHGEEPCSFLQQTDLPHFIFSEGKAEDIEIFPNMPRIGTLRKNDVPFLDMPSEDDLHIAFSIFRGKFGKQWFFQQPAVPVSERIPAFQHHEKAQTGYVVTARLSSITDKLEQQDKKQSGPSATGSVFTGVPIGLPVFTLLI